MAFGTTPVSTTVLGTDQFPAAAVYVPGTAGGNFIATQGGPASSADVNGNISAPAAIYVPDGNDVTQGTTTDVANANTVIGQLKQIRANTASVVIGSGTVTADQGGAWTVTSNQGGAWTVTANAGTNLNTSLLALDTSVNGILLAQGSATSGEKGPLIQGAVTTAAPAYTTAQTSPLSLTTAGALRVDGSAVTQPVSGSVTVAGTVTANAGSGNFTVAQATGTNLHTVVDSGTVTANIGTTNGLALDATISKLNVGQSTALGTNTGPMMQGSVTTAAPTYTTGNINPVSLTTAGALRVDGSGATQPVSGSVAVSGTVTANAGSGNFTVIQATGSNLHAVLDAGTAVIGHVVTDSGSTSTVTQATGTNLHTVVDSGAVSATQSGTWTVQPGNTANTTPWLVQGVAATTNGSTPSHTMSAASTNATSLKASAGMVYGLSISNANAAARYFKLYNKASAPTVGTDTPVLTVQVPGSGTVIRAYPVGLTLATGIAWATTTGIADADTGAVGLNDLSIDIDYK